MKIIFCGGGSGGHVMPALTLIEEIKNIYPATQISYIGSYQGIERSLVVAKGIPYRAIHTGKIRRYFSIQNFIDLFKVGMGLIQSLGYLLFESRDTIIFSTGGFVSVPVVIAAWMTGKKVYVHEQTARLGLANQIASRFATKFFISFEESRKFLPAEKVIYSGYPIRNSFFKPLSSKIVVDGIDLSAMQKPLLFVTGGGNGSHLMNQLVKDHLAKWSKDYYILHQVGKNQLGEFEGLRSDSYLPVAFLGDEMIDIMKKARVIISRAGAGTVCELLALGKKSVFIPLKIAQKNEQYHNAMEAHRKLGSIVIGEDEVLQTNWDDLLAQDYSVKTETNQSRAQEIILSEVFRKED